MKTKFLLLLTLMAFVMGCSDEQANVQVFLSTNPYPVIPSTAASCLAKQSAGSEAPAQDIEADYYRIPVINFGRKDPSKAMVVSLIRLTVQLPGTGPNVCTYGGDQLAALDTTVWKTSAVQSGESIIPAGRATFSTNCALYCGGIKLDSATVATGNMEIFGLERAADGEETPVKVQTFFSIQSF